MSETIYIPSEPTQILMVRHAEVFNPADILYGRLPRYRLSDRGVEQARATGRWLSTRPVAAIYSSPLLRARQTAKIFSGYHPDAPLSLSSDLLEVKTSYEGSPNSILQPGFSFFEPLRDPQDESMSDVWTRIQRFLSRTLRRHTGQTVIAVSHADPITIMRLGLLGHDLTVANLHGSVYPARGSINQIEVSRRNPVALAYFDVNSEGQP